ncbi:hypothetical protein ACWA7J_14085 [Leptothrix sp. BB-4]
MPFANTHDFTDANAGKKVLSSRRMLMRHGDMPRFSDRVTGRAKAG